MDPVFLEGRFTRVELLDVIGLCGFRCYPRVICRVETSVFAILWRWALERQILKYSVNKLVTNLHFVLLRGDRMFDLLLQVMLLLITDVVFIFVCLRQR